jgi:hypothetical protein
VVPWRRHAEWRIATAPSIRSCSRSARSPASCS